MVSSIVMKKLIIKLTGLFLNSTAYLFPKTNGEHSFKLLCRVSPPPLKETTRAFFDTGEQVLIPTSHHNVVLHFWGTGPKKILFMHGWQSNSKQWQPYVEQLNLEEYTLYALDAPGHGASKGKHLNVELYREAISNSVSHIGEVDCAICHSLGCLSTSYAYLHNNLIKINSYVIMGSPSGMDAIFTYFENMLSLSEKAIKNLHAKIRTIAKIPLEEITMSHFFLKINKPTLVIHEKSDSITPIAPIKKAIGANPEVKHYFTEGQDHMLKEQETIDIVIQFLSYQNQHAHVL